MYILNVYTQWRGSMRTTTVFKSGNSMAVRLPKDFIVKSSKLEILKKGNDIILREIPKNLSQAFEIMTSFPEDYFSQERIDLPPQKRNF